MHDVSRSKRAQSTRSGRSTTLTCQDALWAYWRRGNANLDIKLTGEGMQMFRAPASERKISFRQGPLMQPSAEPDNKAPVEVLAWFRTGVGRNGADPATMVDTPAIIRVEFGEGRVLLFSPHPEQTSGMEGWLRLGIDWTIKS